MLTKCTVDEPEKMGKSCLIFHNGVKNLPKRQKIADDADAKGENDFLISSAWFLDVQPATFHDEYVHREIWYKHYW